jgi:ABC-type glycerol-3-phosphate transport system permease component
VVFISVEDENAGVRSVGTLLRPFTAKIREVTKILEPVMAGYCIVSAPLLAAFFITSKQFIAGLVSDSVKM